MLRDRLQLAVLLSGSALTALVLVVLIPVLPMLAMSFGGAAKGAALAQAVMTTPALGLIAGGFASAAAIKTFGAHRLLLVGLALYGLSGSAGLYLAAPSALLASRFFLGVAASFVGIGTTAIIAARYAPDARAKLLGIKGALGSVGGIIGILLGGELGSVGGWRLPFAIYLVGWLLLMLALAGRTNAVAAPPPSATGDRGAGLRALWPFYAMIVAFSVVMMMTNTQLSFLLHEIGVRDPAAMGRVAVMASVGAMIGGFGYGVVRRTIGARNCFMAAFATWTVGLATLGFAQTAMVAVIGSLVTGIATGVFLPHMVTTLTAAAAPSARDRAIAMFYSAVFLGDFLNPFIVEPMSEALTRHGAFRAVAAFTFTAMLVALARRSKSGLVRTDDARAAGGR